MTEVAPKSGRDFEPRFWAQNRARFSARLCRDWRRDFAAIGGATSPQAEARRDENAGSHSCRSLRATARPSALHSAVLTLRLSPELEVSRPGRRSSWSAAWQCGRTACASAATDERTPAWGMAMSDSRFRASMAVQKTTRCICSSYFEPSVTLPSRQKQGPFSRLKNEAEIQRAQFGIWSSAQAYNP